MRSVLPAGPSSTRTSSTRAAVTSEVAVEPCHACVGGQVTSYTGVKHPCRACDGRGHKGRCGNCRCTGSRRRP